MKIISSGVPGAFALAALAAQAVPALAQNANTLPAVTVSSPKAAAVVQKPARKTTRVASQKRRVATPIRTAPVIARNNEALPPVTVTTNAAGQGSLTVPSVADQKQRIADTAASVGFVDAKNFRNSYANNLRDVLKDAPGVFVQERYSQELRLSIRGSGLSRSFHTRGIEILQDGIPTNASDGSGDFYQIDPLSLRSVEIYKGGNALAFGSSTLGGAVNFITPTGYTAFAPTILRIEGGSFGTKRINGQISRIYGDVDVSVSGTLNLSDGYRAHETQKSGQFNANVGWKIAPGIETRFYGGVYIFNQRLPGTLALNDVLTRPGIAPPAIYYLDQQRNTRTYRAANKTSWETGFGQLDVTSWYIHKNLYHPIFQVVSQDGYTFGVSPKFTTRFNIADMRDDFVVGLRMTGGRNGARQFTNFFGDSVNLTTNQQQNAYNYQAFAENKLWLVPQFAAVAGIKVLTEKRLFTDYANIPAQPSFSLGIPGLPNLPAVPSNTIFKQLGRTYNGANPKYGFLWQPTSTMQFFVNATKSMDVPDFSDLTQTTAATRAFVPLLAQSGWTGEIGTRGRWERLAWDVTFYRSWVRNELLQFTTSAFIPASTFNAPRTLHQGVEASVTADLSHNFLGFGDKLSFTQLWNYNDFRFQGDATYCNNALPVVPRHVLRSTLSWKHPQGFYVAPAVDLVPQGAWVDYANTKRAPSYALLGLTAGYEVERGISLFLDARNLTNKRYVSDLGAVTIYQPLGTPYALSGQVPTATFYPGDGRAIYAGARAQF